MRAALFSLLLFLTCAGAARADILFLDFNLGDGEIAAAKRAAEARHEKLIVIRNHKTDQLDDPQLSPDVVGKKLDELETGKREISSVIISGHDGNGSFFGEPGGGITTSELDELIQAHPKFKNSVRSMYLWGCYTATPGALDHHWKGSFPNIEVIAGFSGSAPANIRLANFTVLEDLLKKEHDLIRTRDNQKLLKSYQAIRNISQVSSAMIVCDKYLAKDRVETFQEALAECQLTPQAREWMANYNCFEDAQDPKCADVPANTGSSPLRSLYNFEQSRSQCLHESGNYQGMPEPETLIRLIFFKNVWANFSRIYASQLKKFDEQLRVRGAPPEALFGDASKLSRGELVKRIRAQQSFLNGKVFNEKDPTEQAIDSQLNSASFFITRVGVFTDAACIPFNWVEPGASQPSSCKGNLDEVQNRIGFLENEKPALEPFAAEKKDLDRQTADLTEKWVRVQGQPEGKEREQSIAAISRDWKQVTKKTMELQVRMVDARIAAGQTYLASHTAPGGEQSAAAKALSEYLESLRRDRKVYQDNANAGGTGLGMGAPAGMGMGMGMVGGGI